MIHPKDLLFPGDKAQVSPDNIRYVSMGSVKNAWDWIYAVIAWNEFQKKKKKEKK